MIAQDTGNVEMAQSAIGDAFVAKEMMPENPLVICVDLRAHLVAMGVFRDAGEKDRADQSLRHAEKDAQKLEQFPALPMSYQTRWYYLNLTRQEELAYEVARRGYQEAETYVTRRIYVESLYERGEFEKALQVIEREGRRTSQVSRPGRSLTLEVMRPFILAEVPDGPSRALEAYGENCNRIKEGYDMIFNQTSLLLVGRRKEAMEASRAIRRHEERLARFRREHMLRILDYCGGGLSEEEFLKAEAGSRLNQCEVHFYVALDRLAQGDRTGAREHFQKTLATGVFWFIEYEWSRLFLKRMDQDPTWPSWIPLREPATPPTTTP
jgi:tetratricopeptide (TPR) repeat protein